MRHCQWSKQKTNKEIPPYNLPHTEVRELRSEITNVKYILYISLPRSNGEETHNSAFPAALSRGLRRVYSKPEK
jgi:hypothetical protein